MCGHKLKLFPFGAGVPAVPCHVYFMHYCPCAQVQEVLHGHLYHEYRVDRRAVLRDGGFRGQGWLHLENTGCARVGEGGEVVCVCMY